VLNTALMIKPEKDGFEATYDATTWIPDVAEGVAARGAMLRPAISTSRSGPSIPVEDMRAFANRPDGRRTPGILATTRYRHQAASGDAAVPKENGLGDRYRGSDEL
jgi:hypothetical protein